MKKNTTHISAVLFKIVNGERINEFIISGNSDIDTVRNAHRIHKNLGLIGRYYLETSEHRIHQINTN